MLSLLWLRTAAMGWPIGLSSSDSVSVPIWNATTILKTITVITGQSIKWNEELTQPERAPETSREDHCTGHCNIGSFYLFTDVQTGVNQTSKMFSQILIWRWPWCNLPIVHDGANQERKKAKALGHWDTRTLSVVVFPQGDFYAQFLKVPKTYVAELWYSEGVLSGRAIIMAINCLYYFNYYVYKSIKRSIKLTWNSSWRKSVEASQCNEWPN
jgi:hypothetical protein